MNQSALILRSLPSRREGGRLEGHRSRACPRSALSMRKSGKPDLRGGHRSRPWRMVRDASLRDAPHHEAGEWGASDRNAANGAPMPKRSAGLLMYRRAGPDISVLLVHPGGPFWAKKDLGAWSIPKGEYAEGEDPLAVARREFEEETGAHPAGGLPPLGPRTQPGPQLRSPRAVARHADPAPPVC